MVRMSARSAKTSQELACAVEGRLAALARAHELTLPKEPGDAARADQSTTLHALVQTIVSP
jgi:two-component sensor histidine kinase